MTVTVSVWVDNVKVQDQELVIGTEMDTFSFILRPEPGWSFEPREIKIQAWK